MATPLRLTTGQVYVVGGAFSPSSVSASGNISSGGQFLAANGTAVAPSYAFTSDPATGSYWATTSHLAFSTGGAWFASMISSSSVGLQLKSNIPFGWAPSTAIGSGSDVVLVRDAAADTLAQRRGTNPQTFRLYNTYTDASNYERLNIIAGAASTAIFNQQAGTGVIRPLDFGLNGVALWRIQTTGHWLTISDNTYDIGASGATRPRTGYFGTSVLSPVFTAATSYGLGGNASYNIIGPIAVRTAPTIASGFGAGVAIVASNGSAAFTINVGTGGSAQNGVITMPAATTGWACKITNLTNPATSVVEQTATTTTSVTVQNYSRTTGIAAAWAASDILQFQCMGY